MEMTRKKKITALLAYILGLFVLFAIILFPDDAVRNCLQNNLQQWNPKAAVTVGAIGPALPFSIQFQDCLVYYDDKPVVAADSLKLTPAAATLVGGDPAGTFTIKLLDGRIRGEAGRDQNGGYQARARLAGLQLEKMAILQNLTRHRLRGVLQGNVKTQMESSSLAVTAELQLSEGGIVFAEPVFGLAEIPFDMITAELTMTGRTLGISECDISGSEVSGRITGQIMLMTPYGASRLNLQGAVKPHASLVSRLQKQLPVDVLIRKNQGPEGFPVKITGTIAEPRLSLQ